MTVERKGKSVEELTAEMLNQLVKGVEVGVKTIEADSKLLVGVDTGTLRRNLTSDVGIEGNLIVGQVGSNVEYAFFHSLKNPYLTTAVDNNLQFLINSIKGAVK